MNAKSITDAYIRHHVYLSRYGTTLAKTLVALLADDTILGLLNSKYTDRKKIEKRIREVIAPMWNKITEKAQKELSALVDVELAWLSALLDVYAGKAASPSKLIEDALNHVLAHANNTPKTVLRATFESFQAQAATITVAQNSSVYSASEAATMLKNAYIRMKAGVDVSVRTAVYTAAAQAREAAYAANDDIIRGVLMSAVLDGRTTNYCKRIDGEIFKAGEGPRPPFHIRCRTIALPVFVGQSDEDAKKQLEFRVAVGPGDEYTSGDNREKSTRKNIKDGIVNVIDNRRSTKSYAAFLKSQVNTDVGRTFIRDTLGKTRGNLFIDGVLNGKSDEVERLLKSVLAIELKGLSLSELKKVKVR